MRPRPFVGGRWTVLILAALLAGCALTVEQKAELDAAMQVKADPALFKVEALAPDARLPMKLALLVPPTVPGAWALLPYSPGAWMTGRKDVETPVQRRMQTAMIVEAALRKSLAAALQGELKTVSSMPIQGDSVDGILELVSVQFDYDERRLTWFPIPIPFLGGLVIGQFEASARLSLQLRLVDALGRQVWTRNYDDGSRTSVWDYPGSSDWRAGIQLVAHEAAWRLSQQVLRDLRDWQATERTKPRVM